MKTTVKPGQIWEERKPFVMDYDSSGKEVLRTRTAEILRVTKVEWQKSPRVWLKTQVEAKSGDAMFLAMAETTVRQRWKLIRDVKL